jgi:hypothetical protein
VVKYSIYYDVTKTSKNQLQRLRPKTGGVFFDVECGQVATKNSDVRCVKGINPDYGEGLGNWGGEGSRVADTDPDP